MVKGKRVGEDVAPWDGIPSWRWWNDVLRRQPSNNVSTDTKYMFLQGPFRYSLVKGIEAVRPKVDDWRLIAATEAPNREVLSLRRIQTSAY
jgi:hypothetical protein